MEVIIQPSPDAAAAVAARIIGDLIRRKPDAVLGLATGGTPCGLYKELIRMHRQEGLDFSGVTTFNLDEYVGIPPGHPASYHRFMQENLFAHVNVPPGNIHIPDGNTPDIPQFCARYEEQIRQAGGIDLQVLGIGHDGHIGFNESTSSLVSRTRIKTLTEETLAANQRFFAPGEPVPRHVITMGVGTIMDSRTCLMLAFGEGKAKAVASMVEGPITAMCPASILQMHRQTSLILDPPAASRLTRIAYYQHVFANKPDFQRVSAFPVI
ncbi:MAG: glucosamine-6-phosphate deaminase [Verrucomicrobiae bacterium]